MYTIYNLGSSNRNWNEFLDILKHHEIKIVADVRRFPTSKLPWFNSSFMKKNLEKEGIKYIHLVDLGGFRRGGYERYTHSTSFKKAIAHLTNLAEKERVAFFCKERDVKHCHRRYIVRELEKMGWRVVNL